VKEKEIENNILAFLVHIPGGKFWKNQSGGIYDSSKRVFRKSYNKFHINGVSDILGVVKGRLICIEVKAKKGRVSPSQKIFIEEVNRLGGLAFIAKSIEDVEEQFIKEGIWK